MPLMPLQLFANNAAGPFVTAHLGFSAKTPENTMAALKAARHAGAHALEVDVLLTRDGHLVLMHHPTVDRTTDGRGRVKDLTLSELRSPDAGSWFGPAYTDEAIPTLDDVLQWNDSRFGLYVDMKEFPPSDCEGIELIVSTRLGEGGWPAADQRDPRLIDDVELVTDALESAVGGRYPRRHEV